MNGVSNGAINPNTAGSTTVLADVDTSFWNRDPYVTLTMKLDGNYTDVVALKLWPGDVSTVAPATQNINIWLHKEGGRYGFLSGILCAANVNISKTVLAEPTLVKCTNTDLTGVLYVSLQRMITSYANNYDRAFAMAEVQVLRARELVKAVRACVGRLYGLGSCLCRDGKVAVLACAFLSKCTHHQVGY